MTDGPQGAGVGVAAVTGDDTTPPPARILLVDDRRENLLALSAVLEPLGPEIVLASSGKEALKHVLTEDFAVILLDVQMPDIDGFETATLIKQRDRSRNIPIIFVTAINTEERYAFRGYQTGAVDYLSKPIDPDMLRSKVRVFIELHQQAQRIALQAERLREAELREAERRREEAAREAERRHMMELAAREAQLRQFKETLDATQDAVFLFAPDTLHFLYVNQGAVALSEYSAAELLQMTLFDLVAEEAREATQQSLAPLLSAPPKETEVTALVRPFETVYRRKSGKTIPVEVLTQFFAPNDGPARFVSIVRDITERKRAEAELSLMYEREKKIAEVLRQSIVLTPPEDLFPGLTLATLYQAAWDEANVGGDYLDVFALEPGKVALIVGDVSGKGLAAAARIAEAKYALRAFLREVPDPARALARLNTLMSDTKDLAGDDFGGITGMGQFICVSVAVLNTRSGEATLAVAGSEPPLIVRGTGVSAEQTQVTGMPVGISPNAIYKNAPYRLAKGDLLLLLTDGITEARKGKDFFGYEGFQQAATEAAATGDAQKVGKAVLEAARRFAGGKLHDDVCLLVAMRH